MGSVSRSDNGKTGVDLRSAVQAELERVLESLEFRQSEQSKKMLRYLVEHSLENRRDLLKERVIGVALFGRETGYDTNDEPIVRVRANEIRKRLARYYQEHVSTPVHLGIHPGAYVVDFGLSAAPEAPEPAPAPVRVPRRLPLWSYAAAVAAVVLLAAAILWFRRPADILNEFWRPALDSPSPVILCTGHPVVYRFTNEFNRRIRGEVVDHYKILTDPIRLAPDQILYGRDVVTVPDQYVGLGSAHAVARIHGWLARNHKDSEIRFGNDLSFTDLRKAPAVLIGAFQNRWTLELTRRLRFVFETFDGVPGVLDKQTGKTWTLPKLAESGRTEEDYVIVSRIFDSDTGQFLISGAGITQYGGHTVSEVLTNPATLADALKGLKPGWQRRNLQLLFHVNVVGHSPGPPRLIALHDK